MSEEIGKRIGDYEILGELGSGGMGRVYKVRNVISDRIEAMKVLLPDVANRQELAARFQREIKLLGALNHPNIAVLRTALTVENQLVMIMEFVEGTTLAERLSQGPILVADTMRYMDQVLNALSYAHQQNVIHRDIKPANIILTPQGVIKVMDFGIARSGEDRSLTMTGTTLGSLSYMSPEQVKGEATDARSDIYSVGITLYEMVTGQRPFQAHSDYSIMAAHVKEAPKPPIELQQGLPPALNEIILMAIAKDPAQRFQTADAFRNALGSVVVPAGVIAAGAPVVSPDAVTATLNVPVIPAAAASTPTAPMSAKALPPPISPMPMPPPVSTHRGLYMTLGALVVLVGLVLAGIYVPRMSKTQATSSPANASQQSQTPPDTPGTANPNAADAPPPTPSSTGLAADQPTPQPGTQMDSAAASTPTPSTPAPGSAMAKAAPAMHAAPSKKSNAMASGSGAMVAAGLKEAESAVKSNGAVTAPVSDGAADAASLQEIADQTDQLSNRVASVDGSLDQLQQQQSSSGYGMRGDIVAKRASMKSNLAKAEAAVKQKDLSKAKKYLGMAQGDVESLEHFLGH
jgi:serine/threonine-protein kinase